MVTSNSVSTGFDVIRKRRGDREAWGHHQIFTRLEYSFMVQLIQSQLLREILSGTASISEGGSVDNKTFISVVAEDGWRSTSPLKGVMDYLASGAEVKVPIVTLSEELAPILASLLGLNRVNLVPPPCPESDTEILERLKVKGDYDFLHGSVGKVCGVTPRQGHLYSLERENFHTRDARIIFEEDAHVYFLLSEDEGPSRFRGSVSSAYGRWFSHFDADEVVRKNLDRWLLNPQKEYHSIAAALRDATEALGRDIKETLPQVASDTMAHLWNINNLRERASEKGTAMHLALEQRCNDVPEEDVIPNLTFDGAVTLPEVQYEHFIETVVNREGLKPYRTEWSVYDTAAILSGQIDSLWVDRHGKFHMLDWKRCKNESLGPEEKHWNRYGTGPCASVPDTDYGHYGCQQALYAYILENNYNIKVESMRLVQFHPTALDTECRVIEVDESFRGVAEAIVLHRMSEMETTTPCTKRARTTSPG